MYYKGDERMLSHWKLNLGSLLSLDAEIQHNATVMWRVEQPSRFQRNHSFDDWWQCRMPDDVEKEATE